MLANTATKSANGPKDQGHMNRPRG